MAVMAIFGLLPYQRFEVLLQTCDQPFELIDAFLALSTRPQSGLSAIALSYTEIASSTGKKSGPQVRSIIQLVGRAVQTARVAAALLGVPAPRAVAPECSL